MAYCTTPQLNGSDAGSMAGRYFNKASDCAFQAGSVGPPGWLYLLPGRIAPLSGSTNCVVLLQAFGLDGEPGGGAVVEKSPLRLSAVGTCAVVSAAFARLTWNWYPAKANSLSCLMGPPNVPPYSFWCSRSLRFE